MGEGLAHLIAGKRSVILTKWCDAAYGSYAPDTSRFLKSQKDPFANPVGNALSSGLAGLLDQLPSELDRQRVTLHLDPIMRIRAVQDFSPSQATAFILTLKHILRGLLSGELRTEALRDEFGQLEANIDRLCLMAFDLYVSCREKVYQLKANETRNRVFRAFERAGLVAKEAPSEGAD